MNAALDSADSRAPKRWIALVLALLVPGLGHLYLGRALRGAVILAVPLVAFATALLLGQMANYRVYSTITLGWAIFHAFLTIDAGVLAWRRRGYVDRWYRGAPTLALYALLACGVIIIGAWGWASGAFGARTLRVVQNSMAPTIEPGEIVLLNTRAYRNHPPRPGDVIAVPSPFDGEGLVVRRVLRVGTGRNNSDAADRAGVLTLADDNPDAVPADGKWTITAPWYLQARVTFIVGSPDPTRIGLKVERNRALDRGL